MTLLTPDDRPPRISGFARAMIVSAVLHAIAFVTVPNIQMTSRFRYAPDLSVGDTRRVVTPLVLPPDIRRVLTQKEPNKGKPAEELNLEGLMAKPDPRLTAPASPPPAPRPRQFVAPGQAPTPASAGRQQTILSAPEVQVAQTTKTPDLPAAGNALAGVNAPPPPPKEKPKLAFESVGAGSTGNNPTPGGLIPKTKTGVEEAVRAVARGTGAGSLTVGDVGDLGGGGGIPNSTNPTQFRNGSTLQLLSDPQGVDFRPYLIQILAAVKRNWQSVTPESARLGRQGKVSIQFAIDKTGRVPKLVIASGSGTDALDRAAVAAISMTNPFPPLPAEFRGDQIRLQFAFLYNIPRQ